MDFILHGAPLVAQISACVSVFGSSLSLLSFVVCPEWKKKLFTLESLYFWLSISNLLELQNFIFHPTSRNEYCCYQAVSMQVFWISTWFYECFLAVETSVLIHSMKKSNSGLKETNSFSLSTRNIFYHLITITLSAAGGLYVGLSSTYDYLESWCWLDSARMRLYFGYLPVWFVMLVIIVCDVYIIWAVYLSILQHIRISSANAIANPNPNNSSDSTTSPLQRSPSSTESSLSTRTMSRYLYLNRQIFFRFALGPFLMIVLHLPGSILRFSQAVGISMSPSVYSFWSYAQAACDPMHGSINALVWVLSDPGALKEWSDFLSRYAAFLLGREISSSPPLLQTAERPVETDNPRVGESDVYLRMSSGHLESYSSAVDNRATLPNDHPDVRTSTGQGQGQEGHSPLWEEILRPTSPSYGINSLSSSIASTRRSSGSRMGLLLNKWTWGSGVRSESSHEDPMATAQRQSHANGTTLPRQSYPSSSSGGSLGGGRAQNPMRPSPRPQFVSFESERDDSEVRRSSSLMYR